jgi:HEAT repeat protein
MSTDKRRINQHIENLSSADDEVSNRAKVLLMRHYGNRALDELIECCSHVNPAVRFRAVWALGHTQDSRAYETILRLIDDEDEAVRYDATLALGILGDERAIVPLVDIWLGDDQKRPAVDAISKMGLKAFSAVEGVLKFGYPHARWSAVAVLGSFSQEFADVRSMELLQESLNDKDSDVRAHAEYWLQELGLLHTPRV